MAASVAAPSRNAMTATAALVTLAALSTSVELAEPDEPERLRASPPDVIRAVDVAATPVDAEPPPSPVSPVAVAAIGAIVDVAEFQAPTPLLAAPVAVGLSADIDVTPKHADAGATSVALPAPRPSPRFMADSARSPMARLGLSAKARAKAEDCLARAIYFEARGETVRGQVAVAQVIINRVFSRFYPNNVCAVVYQNAHRRNACQFSFACNGKRDDVRDAAAWALAMRLASLTLDGKVWEADVGKATHYHAVWVNPWWVSTMEKLTAHGVHIFYRPTRWGDGSDEPDWHRVAHTVVAAIN